MTTQPAFFFHQGTQPLLISMPHVGTEIPLAILKTMQPVAAKKADTDWHLPLLYNMAQSLGASVLHAHYSRYVIDLNRPRDDANLYPGQDTTGLCPIDTFAKEPLYVKEKMPDANEIANRITQYWQPYHQQLQIELQRLVQTFGYAILWDAHSIASMVPRFFEGQLPELNLGSADGKSCAEGLQQALLTTLQQNAGELSYVWNGRFKGGYITRYYGQPSQHIHAVQLEMAQCVYMNEQEPFAYRPDLAEKIQPLLTQLLQTCLTWAKHHYAHSSSLA